MGYAWGNAMPRIQVMVTKSRLFHLLLRRQVSNSDDISSYSLKNILCMSSGKITLLVFSEFRLLDTRFLWQKSLGSMWFYTLVKFPDSLLQSCASLCVFKPFAKKCPDFDDMLPHSICSITPLTLKITKILLMKYQNLSSPYLNITSLISLINQTWSRC